MKKSLSVLALTTGVAIGLVSLNASAHTISAPIKAVISNMPIGGYLTDDKGNRLVSGITITPENSTTQTITVRNNYHLKIATKVGHRFLKNEKEVYRLWLIGANHKRIGAITYGVETCDLSTWRTPPKRHHYATVCPIFRAQGAVRITAIGKTNIGRQIFSFSSENFDQVEYYKVEKIKYVYNFRVPM